MQHIAVVYPPGMPAARQGRIPYGTLCAYAIAVSSPKAVIRTASGV
jgi:hypothetical protein